jgi:hypothetical protein
MIDTTGSSPIRLVLEASVSEEHAAPNNTTTSSKKDVAAKRIPDCSIREATAV